MEYLTNTLKDMKWVHTATGTGDEKVLVSDSKRILREIVDVVPFTQPTVTYAIFPNIPFGTGTRMKYIYIRTP